MLREQYPEGKIVVGNTEIGIEMKYGRKTYPTFIAATHIAELNHMEVSPGTAGCPGSVNVQHDQDTLGPPLP